MYNSCVTRPARKKTRLPHFNFDAEVSRIRRDFPDETKNITFIDLSATDARARVCSWVLRESGITDQMPVPPEIFHTIDRILSGNNLTTVSFSGLDRLITFRTSYTASMAMDGKKLPYFGLYHELGHCLVPQALPLDDRKLSLEDSVDKEIRADVFALLYGMRNGIFSDQDAQDIVKSRLWNALSFNIGHFTSEAVENARRSVELGGFDPSTLTRLEIRGLPTIFAEKSKRPNSDLENLREDLYEFGGQHRAEFVAILEDVVQNEEACFTAFSKNPQLCRQLKTYFQELAARQPAGSLNAFIAAQMSAHLKAPKRRNPRQSKTK